MGRWSGLRSGCTHASRLGVESASRRVRRTCGHDLLRPDVRGAAALSQGSRGFDFTGYKRSSLMRRVDRRMAQVAVAEYSDYLDYLQVHPEEFTGLFNTILINVTGFFRDPDAWEYLRTDVLPAVLAGRGSDGPIRVWSAGCASGEEAYTLAMLLAEALGLEQFRLRAKIYATDVDEEGLLQARHATYGERDIQDAPISRIDLLVCRNTLMYFNAETQRGS